METTGVICAVPAEFIKCLNSTHLARKEVGKGLSMSWEALLHKCNEQCRQYGLSDYWEQIGDEEGSEMDHLTQTTDNKPKAPLKKWQVCQAFHAVNAATQIPAFPSGDLKAKQQKIAGKCWVSVIDLAASYYAIKMDEAAVPYTAFYVEGKGYFVYV